MHLHGTLDRSRMRPSQRHPAEERFLDPDQCGSPARGANLTVPAPRRSSRFGTSRPFTPFGGPLSEKARPAVKRIGIINCHEVSKRCSASGCLKALQARTGSFERYEGEEIQLLSFAHCNGCGEDAVAQVVARAERMRDVGVEVIHLSTCMKSRCGQYEAFLEALSPRVEVVGYSHAKRPGADPPGSPGELSPSSIRASVAPTSGAPVTCSVDGAGSSRIRLWVGVV